LAQNQAMPSFERRNGKVRVRLYRHGKRYTETFSTKKAAERWVLQVKAQLDGRGDPSKTLLDAYRRYAAEVSPTKKGKRWEIVRLRLFERITPCSRKLSSLTPADIARWRDERLKAVSGSSVAREMNLLRSVLNVARLEWGWMGHDPMDGVRRPPRPPGRARGVTELEALQVAAGPVGTKSWLAVLAFEFAIETGMRRGELLSFERVNAKTARLPATKNGSVRVVPLSPRAREILDTVGRFDISAAALTEWFGRVRDKAGIKGLHFHDARGEAIRRLSKKLDVFELARVTGHRDLKSLMEYYDTTPEELADRL